MKSHSLRVMLTCAFLAVLGFFLLTEHRAHLFGALPYVFLLACPLFHLLLHRRHGGHDSDPQQDRKQAESQDNVERHSHG
ncbi:MAG: DUF2933 domain-containing protein [Nitrospira sp. CG24B]|jgi:hypothetical protein|nr:MAG: DUF2933 domain-containing protein [Nitrospira sp. CG24B]